MKLQIYSFRRIQKRAERPFDPGTAIISIGDPELDPPRLLHKPELYLRLAFDDITLEGLRKALELPEMQEDALEQLLIRDYDTFPFTRELAEITAAFIRSHMGQIRVLICQCQMGQSRSAGVAAAVAEYLSGNGHVIFADERYSPNRLVYDRLLAALQKGSAAK